MLRTSLLAAVFVGALATLAPAPAAAQAGLGTDIITGVVTAEDGTPLQDVTVEAYSLETQVTRRARTDVRGRFTILFPDGGGQYRMTARMLGMTPHTALITRDADGRRICIRTDSSSKPAVTDSFIIEKRRRSSWAIDFSESSRRRAS